MDQNHSIRQEQYWHDYVRTRFQNYASFCSELQVENTEMAPNYLAFCSESTDENESDGGIVSYDASARINPTDQLEDPLLDKGSLMELAETLRDKGLLANFDKEMFNNSNNTFQDVVNEGTVEGMYLDVKRNEDLLLLLHQKFSHVPMVRLQRMASLGLLPSRIAKCAIPLCQACVYGKMTRKQWRTKQPANKKVTKTATRPGEIVSVDQLESPIDGFIAQMKGRLFKKQRYRCATIYVDHFSGLSYVYLQQSTTAEETLEGKEAFEFYANTFGVKIMHYHADNGRFAENAWLADIAKKSQSQTFSGVGAHHQNGRAEKRIRDLQDQARTSLIFANRLWPADAVTVELWPYALRHANESFNMTNFPDQDESPLEKFSQTKISPNLRDMHPFGCPAYALDGRIQGGQKGRKWETRARMAIYLGPSPQHARSIGLVLSITPGLTSPQFHVKYDDTFATLRNNRVPMSLWQSLAGFLYKQKKSRQIDPIGVIPAGENNVIIADHNEQTNNEDQINPFLEGEPNQPNLDDEQQDVAPANDNDDVSENSSDDESIHAPDRTTRSGSTSRYPTLVPAISHY